MSREDLDVVEVDDIGVLGDDIRFSAKAAVIYFLSIIFRLLNACSTLMDMHSVIQ